MRKVFLDDLPRRNGNNGVNINWLKSIGYKIKFIYDDIESEFEIVGYINDKNPRLKLKLNNRLHEINISSIFQGKLGGILHKKTSEFKIEIGTIFKDKKRDLIIIDRERRERKYIRNNKKENNCNQKWYLYHCNKCGYEGWIVEHTILNQKTGCGCCGGNKRVGEGINDIPTTAPWMVKYFQGGYDEAKLYTRSSNQYINPICPDCGRVKNKKKKIHDIYKTHSIGCSCSDNISYPNKFAFKMLEELGVNFIPEYSPKWIGRKRYDFYFELNKKKYILEMDGDFHKIDNNMNGVSKEESKYIDDYKDEQARLHGIEVIRIDYTYSSYSKFEDLKENILNSKLNELFDFSNINWLKCEEFGLSNLVKTVCQYWNEGINNPQAISNILNISRPTVTSYLRKGAKLRMCDYTKEKALSNRSKIISKNSKEIHSKPIICITNGYVFKSATECSIKSINIFRIKLGSNAISRVCRGERTHHKYYKFKYISDLSQEEYIKYNIENKLNELKNQDYTYDLNTSLYFKEKYECITTNQRFDTAKEAGEYYKIKSYGHINSCCKGERKYCGELNGEKLEWRYSEDYIKQQQLLIHNENLGQAI